MNAPVSLSQTSALEINQLLVSGLVTSPVRDFRCGKAKYKAVFTLQNSSGRFYVQWNRTEWKPNKGDYLMIRGSVFSVPVNGVEHLHYRGLGLDHGCSLRDDPDQVRSNRRRD